jgi:hypothetical protein
LYSWSLFSGINEENVIIKIERMSTEILIMSWNDVECLTILNSLPERKRHRHITSAIFLRGKAAYDLSTGKISQVTRTLLEFMPLSKFVSIFQLILSLAEAAESSLAFSKLLSTVSLRTVILPITKTNIIPHCSICG